MPAANRIIRNVFILITQAKPLAVRIIYVLAFMLVSRGPERAFALSRLLRQLRPAGIERVVLMLRGVQFRQRLLKRRGIGRNLRMLDAVASRGQPRIGLLHTLLDRRKLARFKVGELLLRAS